MKSSQEWNPAALLQSPLFAPLHPLLSFLERGNFPEIREFNELLALRHPAIGVQLGHHLRFVPQKSGRLEFESQYEPCCYLTGEVQTRSENLHDLFNALVWLTFPKAKKAINSRHYQALTNKNAAAESQRGGVRDMATLLDESGVIVVSANPELTDLMHAFQWKELFWQRREQMLATMEFYIFGHGLYEKAIRPYVGMTGQGLVLNVEQEFFNQPMPDRLAYLDNKIAKYLENPRLCLSPRELHPVPLLGVPGWAAENNSATYYDNKSYFRTGRRDSN